MPNIPDITLIGSGIISLLTAREFSQAGARVAIIEKGALGQESSWAGGGILLPLYPWRQDSAISKLVLHSLALYPDLSKQLLESTGIDPEWNDCGLLITQNPDFEVAIAWCKNNKIPFERPETEQLQAFNTEPLNPIWLPTIAQARNPRLLKALVADLQARGVQFFQDCELIDLKYQQRRVTSIITRGGNFAINQLILATGAWSGALWSDLFSTLPGPKPAVYPVTGQMLLFDAPARLLQHMILDGDQYLIPRRDGKILAGSSVEHRGFDKQTTEQAKQQLSDFAISLFPALQSYPVVRHWAGLRPGTEHGIPYISQHPEFDNLSLNAGHFRNGLAMGPASAQLMADIILKRKPALDPAPYSFSSTH